MRRPVPVRVWVPGWGRALNVTGGMRRGQPVQVNLLAFPSCGSEEGPCLADIADYGDDVRQADQFEGPGY